MSTFVENVTPHHPVRREITPTLDPIPDSGQGDSPQNDNYSEDSLDSLEESVSSKESVDNPIKKRNNFKVRSISDCVENEELGSACHRGILKYAGRRLRSLSESCADNYSNSLSYNGESMSALDEWFEEELEEDGEDGDSPKVKKTVRFSETVHRQLFRTNSSILGQRKKNQRKQRSKAKNKSKTSNNSHSSVMGSSTESESAGFMSQDLSDALESVALCDSGIEVSDSDPCPDPCPSQPAGGPTAKKNKRKKGKNNHRPRHASESSCGEMMFDIDL